MATLAELNAIIAQKEQQVPSREGNKVPLGEQFSTEKTLEKIARQPGTVETAAIATGRGFMNIGRALGIADEESQFEQQAFKQLEKESPKTVGTGQIIGETVPFLLGGAVSAIPKILPRVATAIGLGAGEGAIITKGRGGNISEQIKGGGVGGVVAGTAEALFPIIGRIGSALFRRFKGSAPKGELFTAAGKPTTELQEVLDTAGVTVGDLVDGSTELLSAQVGANVAQAERKAFLESQGLTPTKAQVTREATDFQAQQEATKTSGRVREALEGQEALLVNKFDETITGTGGKPVTSGSPQIDSVINKSTQLDNEISSFYKEAGKVAEESGVSVRLVKLKNLLGRSKSDDRITKGLVSSVVGDLKNQGVIKGDSLVGVTVEQAEKIRKNLNLLFNSTNDFGKTKIRQLKNAIDDDVIKIAGSDIFNKARSAKSRFESQLSRAKINKFDANKKSLVRDMLENKIDPDDFTNKVVFSKSYRDSDLNQLKNYMLSGTKEQVESGKKAWNDLRADTLEVIKTSSFKGAEDKAGNLALSSASLKKSLDKIGKGRVNILFNAQEKKFLSDMVRVSELREPVRGTALGKGPSAQAIASLEQRLKKLPIFGALVDFIDVDSAGRAALKAKPTLIKKIPGRLTKDVQSSISAAAVPLALPQVGE